MGGQHRHPTRASVSPAAAAAAASMVSAAQGMDGGHPDPEVPRRGDRPRDGVRNVVPLEVQEYPQAALDERRG